MDWAITTARWNEKHLSFGIWCDLYYRFDDSSLLALKRFEIQKAFIRRCTGIALTNEGNNNDNKKQSFWWVHVSRPSLKQYSHCHNCTRKWQKYELKKFDDGHFEYYDLCENDVIYSLVYGSNGCSPKIHIETTNKVLFLKMPAGFYLELYFNFLSWLKGNMKMLLRAGALWF